MRNWAGNFEYNAEYYAEPKSLGALQDLVKSESRFKALGARHSFCNIADTHGTLVAAQNIFVQPTIDQARSTVSVGPAVTYGTLATYLEDRGYAVHNMASLPHITVDGAVATATHGSGVDNGNLATQVSALRLLTQDGEINEVSHESHGEAFNGMVVGLGGLGIVVGTTLTVEPSFKMRQTVREDLPWSELSTSFDAILSSGYSVSLFTGYQPDVLEQIWVKERLDELAEDDGTAIPWRESTVMAPENRHPIRGRPADGCTQQGGTTEPWCDILPHFRLEYTPSHGDELQSEYFVNRDEAVAAISAVRSLRKELSTCLKISEIRAVASDNLWMSPCYQRDSVGIHFTWEKNWPVVKEVLPLIEQALRPYHVRPHWGKLFRMSPKDIQSQYPRIHDFRELLSEYDPDGKFRNAYFERYIWNEK